MSRRYAEGFESVIDFQRPRPWYLALVFYVFHFFVVFIISILIAEIVYVFMGNVPELRHVSIKSAKVAAFFYVSTIYGLIVYSRQGWKNPWYIFGFIATAGLGMYREAVLGLIPAAITLAIKVRASTRNRNQ